MEVLKSQRHNHIKPYQISKITELEKWKHPKIHGNASLKGCTISINHHQVASQLRHVNMKQNARSEPSNFSRRHPKLAHLTKVKKLWRHVNFPAKVLCPTKIVSCCT